MGVLDGQAVSAAITNPAFINKNIDDSMPNKLAFTRALSGASIADIQQAVNNIYTATGVSEIASGTDYDATPGTISNGDTHEFAFTVLANKFDAATGHRHTGASGDAPPISGPDIIDVPLLQLLVTGSTVFSATGNSTDVSALMAGSSPSSGSTSLGVIVTPPFNRVALLDTDFNEVIDAAGNTVYGRLTESSGVWTLSYYSLVGPAETAFSIPLATDLKWYYRELFAPLDSTPVYSPILETGYRTVRTVAVTGDQKLFGDVALVGEGGTMVYRTGQVFHFSSAILTNSVTPSPVSATADFGTSPEIAHADHIHEGVHSVSASGFDPILGDVTLVGLNGTTISASGNTIYVSSTGGGGGGGSGINAIFRLNDALIPYVNIDGPVYVNSNSTLSSVYISVLNSGSSGSTIIQLNQYRSGALINTATASISAASDSPATSAAGLSGSLSLQVGDMLTCDILSTAIGAPESICVQW